VTSGAVVVVPVSMRAPWV